MAVIIAALLVAVPALAVLAARSRRVRALGPSAAATEECRWHVVGYGGMQVTFACGHAARRVGAFVCRTRQGPLWYRRNVWRRDADAVPCHACFRSIIAASRPEDVPDDPQFRRFVRPR